VAESVSDSVYLSIRINSELKTRFNLFCESKGIKPSLAVRHYIKRFVGGGIPMKFGEAKTVYAGCTVKVGVRMTAEMREAFSDACDVYGMPMSIFIRDFMKTCVESGEFPFDFMLD